MRCLSCQTECPGPQLKIFDELLLCPNCHGMAEKASIEIDREIDRARKATRIWLQQHILRGGLLRGGSGVEEVTGRYRSQVRDVLHAPEVSGVRGEEGRQLPSHRHSEGNGSESPSRG